MPKNIKLIYLFLKKIIKFNVIIIFSYPSYLYGDSVFSSSGLGLSTYKSSLIESNNTNRTIGYNFGVTSGADDQWRMVFFRDQATTGFSYAESDLLSKISYVCDDVFLSYQIGWVLFGGGFSYFSLKATKQDAQWSDLINKNYGLFFGLKIPSGRTTEFFLDIIYTKPQSTIDSVQSAKIGTRQEFFAGGKFNLSKSIYGIIGYKNRTILINLSSENKKEEITMTWLGLEARHEF